MNGAVDLAFDLPAALKQLDRERDEALRRIHRAHEELTHELAAVGAARPWVEKASLTDAAAVLVFDFAASHGELRDIEFGSQTCGMSRQQLATPLPAGKYRALVLLTVRK
jgi:hypothetical protein